jgi:hypothetical protein
LAYEAQEIARQLCLIDIANLHEVGREELLHVQWTKENGATPGTQRFGFVRELSLVISVLFLLLLIC